MSKDENNGPDQEQTPGVGTDGSLTSHHDRDIEEHVGVGTDGSLHNDGEDDDPQGTPDE